MEQVCDVTLRQAFTLHNMTGSAAALMAYEGNLSRAELIVQMAQDAVLLADAAIAALESTDCPGSLSERLLMASKRYGVYQPDIAQILLDAARRTRPAPPSKRRVVVKCE